MLLIMVLTACWSVCSDGGSVGVRLQQLMKPNYDDPSILTTYANVVYRDSQTLLLHSAHVMRCRAGHRSHATPLTFLVLD